MDKCPKNLSVPSNYTFNEYIFTILWLPTPCVAAGFEGYRIVLCCVASSASILCGATSTRRGRVKVEEFFCHDIFSVKRHAAAQSLADDAI